MCFTEAWHELMQATIVNCWNHTKTVPSEPVEEVVVPVAEKVLDELKLLLLDFGKATDDDVCSAEEYVRVEAETWTEAPESDNDENPLAGKLQLPWLSLLSLWEKMSSMMIVWKSRCSSSRKHEQPG